MTDKTAGDLRDATLAAAFVAGAIDPDTRAAARTVAGNRGPGGKT